jgi:hypothetical protein
LSHLADKLEAAAKNHTGYVLYFKNPTHLLRDPKAPPHYHIIIPINSDDFLLLTMLTSKVQKVKDRYFDNKNGFECLVEIKKEQIDITYKDSIVDCNECLHFSKESLLSNPSLQVIACDPFIDEAILHTIKTAIKKSKTVKASIKKKIL